MLSRPYFTAAGSTSLQAAKQRALIRGTKYIHLNSLRNYTLHLLKTNVSGNPDQLYETHCGDALFSAACKYVLTAF